MTPDEGMNRLMFHTEAEPGSFLHMLRPYQGLRDDILTDVKEALRACTPRFADERLPRAFMSALWAISTLGRAWALDPNCTLRLEQLISDADHAKLAAFMDSFENAVHMLLDVAPDELSFDWPLDDA
jgi:hypothetical protein